MSLKKAGSFYLKLEYPMKSTQSFKQKTAYHEVITQLFI